MYFVSSFTVLTTTFQRNSGFILGLNEFVWGTGNMAGSYLGGLLIDVWAFPLPFFVFGLLLAINLPIIVFYRNTLDGYSENNKTGPNAEEENLRYWRLLCDPVFLADMFTLTMEWIITGFNESTLEPSLTEFELTNAEIGMVYTAQFGCYVFGCIIAGVISNYKGDCWYMVFGQCLCCGAYLVLVPLPVLGDQRKLWNVYVCQAFIGLGTSALFVCAYNHALGHAMRSGYPNNTRTNGFVSSCVFSFMVLGGIVTPPLSGLVVERRGYKLGCVFLSCFLGAWIPVTITIWIHTSCTISNSWVVKDSCKSSIQ
ncbi:MFS-type transporter SLC18B1-like [Haemaphysalis longicornis]